MDYPLEKGKSTHSSILAWRIPWTVQSIGSQRVGDMTERLSLHFTSLQGQYGIAGGLGLSPGSAIYYSLVLQLQSSHFSVLQLFHGQKGDDMVTHSLHNCDKD